MPDFRTWSRRFTHRSTVLLQGEKRDGKELIAKRFTWNSTRRDALRSCQLRNRRRRPAGIHAVWTRQGALPAQLCRRKGLFEVADRAALFLDEIGTMSMDTQAKILRVLQDRKFMHWAAGRKSSGRAHHRRHQRGSSARW